MKKRKIPFIIFPMLLLFVVFACILSVWASNSPTVSDYVTIHLRRTEDHLVFGFTTALRINHPGAYDMIDPALKPRLDEWMNTHEPQRCTSLPDLFLLASVENGVYGVTFGCYGADGWISLKIYDIVIKDMRVVDWGEVQEE